jgi:hypothetical protein
MRIDLSGKTAIITGSTAARRRNSLLHVGLAKRAAGTGVTVNSVLPGPTLTEGAVEMLKEKMAAGQSLKEAGAGFVNAMRPSSLIQRAASVEEVANMIVYACSPQASATTGAALRVMGESSTPSPEDELRSRHRWGKDRDVSPPPRSMIHGLFMNRNDVSKTLSLDLELGQEPARALGARRDRFRRKFVFPGAAGYDFDPDVARQAEARMGLCADLHGRVRRGRPARICDWRISLRNSREMADPSLWLRRARR